MEKTAIDGADTDEENLWNELSLGNFFKRYGDNEPDYTEADIKELNPKYKHNKLVKIQAN